MKRNLLRISLAAATLAASIATPAQTVSWSRSLWAPSGAATSLGNGRFVSRALAVDGTGNVVVTGTAASSTPWWR